MQGWTPWGTQRQKQLLAAGDAAIALLALAGGIGLRTLILGDLPTALRDPASFAPLLILLFVQLAVMYVLELYELSERLRLADVIKTVLATFLTVAIVGGAFFFVRFTLGRTIVSAYAIGFCGGSLLWRMWVLRRWRPRSRPERVLVLGDCAQTRELCDELVEAAGLAVEFHYQEQVADRAGAELDADAGGDSGAGAAADAAGGSDPDASGGSDPDASALIAFVEANGIDTVTYPWAMQAQQSFGDRLLRLRFAGVDVASFPSFFGHRTGRIPTQAIDANWISETLEIAQRARMAQRVRRIFELVLSLALAIVLLPLALLIALIVKLDSRGPAVFVQERLGHYEVPFPLYKFRTMVKDAERESGPVWAAPSDARVTRVGKVLRATGLDEVPQLINIIKGQMSFVGVRPIRRHFADAMATEVPYYWYRFFIRPGVTGWAQVMHDYAGSTEGQRRKLEYELYYLRYASPLLDAAIILKTFKTLLFRRVGRTAPTSGGDEKASRDRAWIHGGDSG